MQIHVKVHRLLNIGTSNSEQGLQPSDKKIKAIQSAPAPQNISQLKSFLYYCKFLSNLSNTLSPLYRLLQKDVRWQWGKSQQQAFEEARQQLVSDHLLAHFDPSKPLILACDASPYGLGAVISHQFEDGTERPVAYAFRSLAPAEKKYSQLEKEALAIIFGVKRFHQYLFGRKFTILSDHQPLQGLFKETKAMASASIRYKKGSDNSNADLLSRISLPGTPVRVPEAGETV